MGPWFSRWWPTVVIVALIVGIAIARATHHNASHIGVVTEQQGP